MSEKAALGFLVLIVLGLVLYKVYFLPSTISFESKPAQILTNGSSPVIVKVYAVNKLGLRIPFRHLDGKFTVREGAEKIEVVSEEKDEIIFRTKNSTGRLVILYYTPTVPFPVEIHLDIESAAVAEIYHLRFSVV